MFDYKGGKNFTGLEGTPDPSRWTGKDLFANYNVFSMAFELPTRLLGANPAVRIWGRVSIRRAGKLVPVGIAPATRPSRTSSSPTRSNRNSTGASRLTTGSASSTSSSTR